MSSESCLAGELSGLMAPWLPGTARKDLTNRVTCRQETSHFASIALVPFSLLWGEPGTETTISIGLSLLASFPGRSHFFDRLQYTINEEKKESHAWCQVDVRGWCQIVVTHKLCVDQPLVYWTTNCIDAVFRMLQSQVIGQDITRKTSRFFVGHHPPHVYSCLPDIKHVTPGIKHMIPDITHVTLSPTPSPSAFAYCKWSKWRWERPGNEAIN